VQLRLHRVADWPPLAWIARLAPADHAVRVWHGPRVETRDDALFEAVWAGDFTDADFDRTDLVFGSGVRLRDGMPTFVSSGATVDRLVWAESDGQTWVSNSLACLLQHLGASLDPTDTRYYIFFGTVTAGLDRYERQLATSAGPVNFTYFDNLRWDGRRLETVAKPHSADGFGSFDDYRAFLTGAIRRIADNMADPARRFPYEMLGTISSGYDSPTVATLAAEAAGLKDVISFHHVRGGREDCGHEVARVLGLNLTLIDREAWRAFELPEVPFMSSDCKGEDVFFRGAQDRLAGKVLLTGYHGDKVWDKNTKVVGPNIVRGDRSGLSMTEYRLWVGYVHCPVPFMGVRHHADVHAISNSEEMRPWDVGGDYTRPLCRRIVEGAGVPRGAFGVAKIGSSILFRGARNVQSKSTMADYRQWLGERAADFRRRRMIPPLLRHAALAPVQWLCRRGGWGLHNRLKGLPRPLSLIARAGRKAAQFGDRELLATYMFPWAVERAKHRYRIPDGVDEMQRAAESPASREVRARQPAGAL
jgi:hypothetical protein